MRAAIPNGHEGLESVRAGRSWYARDGAGPPRMKWRDHPGGEEYAGTVLRRVDWSKELAEVRRLFQEYRDWLAAHADPSARDQPGLVQLDRVIAELPGVYGPPGGEVILAFTGSELAACGALRGWEAKVGEIKRIFVRPDHRGPGFGPILTGALLDRAEELGYERVRVDTLPTMAAAIQFYQEMGFSPIPAYWAHPVPGALYFEWRAPGASGVSG